MNNTSSQATGWVPEDDFAARLLLARKQAGLTVRAAAMRCGVHYATWSTWERGAAPANMVDVVRAIADGLGCDRAWLAWGGQLAPAQMHSRGVKIREVNAAQSRPRLETITHGDELAGRRKRRRDRDARPLPRPVIGEWPRHLHLVGISA